VLLSRRLNTEAPNHKLGTLASWFGLPNNGRAHRALADALTTAHLLVRLQDLVAQRYADQLQGRPVRHELLAALQRAPKTQLDRCVARAQASS